METDFNSLFPNSGSKSTMIAVSSVRPAKMRKTVYLTVLMVTLTTALYSLRDVRQAEVGNDGVSSEAQINQRSLMSDSVFRDRIIRNVKQIENDDQKPKQKTVERKIGTTTVTTTKRPKRLSTISSTTPATVSTKNEDDNLLGIFLHHLKIFNPSTSSTLTSTSTTLSTRPKVTSTMSTTTTVRPSTTLTIRSSTNTEKESFTGDVLTTTVTKMTHPRTGSGTDLGVTVTSATPTKEFCEEPAYHEFPADIFTNKQRADGAVIVHILIGIYMFYALAVVCDEYFVASMERMCESIGLSEDVAGATFMAAGSSAPELFASLLGVYVAKGDVGTGTIVGSAVFNILFVIGFCAYFCGRTLSLNWWPLLRDSTYYAMTVIVLIVVLADGYVSWLESANMLVLYGVYIILMKYNIKLRIWLTENTRLRVMDELTECSQGILMYDDKQIRSSYVQFTNDAACVATDDTICSWKNDDPSQLDVDEIIRDFPRKKVTLYEAALMVMMSRYFRSLTRFRCACRRIIIERRRIHKEGYQHKSIMINESHYPNPMLISREMTKDSREAWKKAPTVEVHGLVAVISWFVTIPVLATLYYTIPDCRNARWERYFVFTFLTAIIWIAFFSYILVWMVTLVGYTLGIPDTIMGITFLAAGTSVPDAYASLIVAKQGMGDMAVANSLGSNVFDILIGLALPWFLKTAVTDTSSMVRIRSSGMVYSVILLFLSIFATIAAVHHCKWKLDKRLGVILLLCYAIFLFFAILIECNVFGFVNYPECEE